MGFLSLSLSHRYVERCCSHRGVVCGGGWSLNVDLLPSGPEQEMGWQWRSPGVGQVWKNPSKIQKYSLSSTGSGCSERFSLFRWNSNSTSRLQTGCTTYFHTAPIWQQTLSGGRRIAWSFPRTTNVLLLWRWRSRRHLCLDSFPVTRTHRWWKLVGWMILEIFCSNCRKMWAKLAQIFLMLTGYFVFQQ